MDSQEATRQIQQMTSFIISEATDKANEIQKRGEEEFSIEVHRLLTESKEKIRQGYERKVKQIETQYAIAKSMAINKQRLEKIKARQEVMNKVAQDSKQKLVTELKDAAKSKAFITKLIVQGLLMLLEQDVTIRCREADKALVQSILKQAADDYAKVIKVETGATRTCRLTLDEKQYLPPAPVEGREGKSCLGGVMLFCQNGKISIDNTIDLRLQLVMEQDKPAIRSLLFPGR
mmetsp:Transcript_71871/g.163152  ORF Transcript_71871/g.163152 Transcript_71871/m.163152 type:complete len:233 (+) Transcript_71871:85-783(+)|eukprot:CAMPEP_0197885506 /NCGR_PEP_ID=MMETSP1439-20131203/13610_1 /TAXON_ID=66791 /ORGANISM="Gonyaulax spinifera, Strain CCMP409" /LENGTH=232 /DNA_ID=CAMNT_0043505261 /DNA_START=73 /DNA_END=771 /DNA_ORIENTATION=+